MKKVIFRFWILLCMAVSLCGCNTPGTAPASLEESMAIPDNGVISASVFEKLKAENKVTMFYGVSNGFRYEWTVFGNAIQAAKDLTLGVEITEATAAKVEFRYLSKEDFGFSPMLSVYLNDKWGAEDAAVYEITKTGSVRNGSVNLTGEEKSILNFTTKKQTGRFEILSTPVLNTTEPDAEPAESPAPSEQKRPTSSESTQSSTDSEAKAPDKIESNSKKPEQKPNQTDSAPKDKPLPAKPEEHKAKEKKSYTCTFSIECSSILNHLEDLESEKLDLLPQNGVIFSKTTVTFYEGESVYDVLQRICKEHKIHLETSQTPMYNSAYVEGIHNLYEFDCGSGSGWMYRVNGWYPNYGCSQYKLSQGDVVEWRYTCNLGKDIGGGNSIGK